MQYLLWAISFVGLWLSIAWVSTLFLEETYKKRRVTNPTITIAIPAYNAGKRTLRTLESITSMKYPLRQIQIIVVDDGSTDTTAADVQVFIQRHARKQPRIQLIRHLHNKGKGAALNTALAQATGTYFAVMDSDSTAAPDALHHLLAEFSNPNTGAVITTVKVEHLTNAYEYLQRVEYILSNLFRSLMSAIGTLFLTHGVLSTFNTAILKKVGGFDGDRNNITEDLEVSMRLRSKGYLTRMAPLAVGYTCVPQTFSAIWRQRIRWFRGFIYNHNKYKHMIANPKYGLYGLFQLPINLISVLLLLTTVAIITYGGIKDTWIFIIRSITINGYFINHVLEFPTLKEFLLGQDLQVMIPLSLSTAIGICLIIAAHRRLQEKFIRYIGHIWFYFLITPYMTSAHWVSSIAQEILKTKRKW